VSQIRPSVLLRIRTNFWRPWQDFFDWKSAHRKASTYKGHHNIYVAKPRVGFEPMFAVFERSNITGALHSAVTGTSLQ